jgi:hypothetical protein
MVTELWPLIEKFVNLWFFSNLIFPWLSVLKVLSTMHMSSSILAIIMSYRVPLVISLFTLAGNRVYVSYEHIPFFLQTIHHNCSTDSICSEYIA